MAEERVAETRAPDGATHTHTTIIEDRAPSGGGGGMLLIVVLLLIAIVVGIWAYTQYGTSEANKNNAIANAANDVGNAAQQAGQAAQNAADTYKKSNGQ